jgi:hypothetical protein
LKSNVTELFIKALDLLFFVFNQRFGEEKDRILLIGVISPTSPSGGTFRKHASYSAANFERRHGGHDRGSPLT